MNKLELVSAAYREYLARLNELTIGELRDFLDGSPDLWAGPFDIERRLVDLVFGDDESARDKYTKFINDFRDAQWKFDMNNREILSEAHEIARAESERSLKLEFESHEWYLPIKPRYDLGYYDDIYDELYGQENVDKDTCPCVSRSDVAGIIKRKQDEYPTGDWGYGTILWEIARPATDEEIAQRGVLERGDA